MPGCYQTRVINAPIEKVWDTIKNFHDLSWCPSVVISCDKIGKINGNMKGAKRLLNGIFEETLLSVDTTQYTFTYSIDEALGSPVSSKKVSNYVGIVSLLSITQTDETFMEWKSSWKANSIEGEEFCHTLYVAMMADLNIMFTKTEG
jgi:hypothetical protein